MLFEQRVVDFRWTLAFHATIEMDEPLATVLA
jgi:hypothetical protein